MLAYIQNTIYFARKIVADMNSIENVGVITHMPDISDWNRQTIEEFRAHEGKVVGTSKG